MLTIFSVILSRTTVLAGGPIKTDEVMLGVRTGHNATFGGYVAPSVQTLQQLGDIRIAAGLQYNTIGKAAVEARPAYVKTFDWGSIAPEVLLAYTRQASVNSLSAGVGMGVSSRKIEGKLDYYYRAYVNRWNSIQEPFNIYYELRAHLLPKQEAWDLQLVITNNEMFELERHYQPTFIVQGKHELNDCIGLSMGVGCKPAGMFNLSTDYYQSFLNIGVHYKW